VTENQKDIQVSNFETKLIDIACIFDRNKKLQTQVAITITGLLDLKTSKWIITAIKARWF